jgi:hypothetical protein
VLHFLDQSYSWLGIRFDKLLQHEPECRVNEIRMELGSELDPDITAAGATMLGLHNVLDKVIL